MGWAEQQAQRIQQNQKVEQQAREWQIHKSIVLDRDSRPLFDALMDAIKAEIQTLKTLAPAAKNLTAYTTHPNAMVVEATAQPIIKIEITYDEPHARVQATVIRQHSFSKFNQKTIGPFSIDLDSRIGITFTGADGQPESVKSIMETILNPLGDFFAGHS